ncbi:hypothetical protein PMKS-000319 [Pichia membranifaciens]|uniref:Uncharacterized protein n=1 Tax=Pichia membranifaciens TaxID=4926 RepID=A0A1Q2YBE9_9ASCO|nr:hypothetical protein PMKS-000319 [Pichia membranifaciens]
MGLLLCQGVGTEKKTIRTDTISHNETSQNSELGSKSSEEKISKRRNDIIKLEDTRNNNPKIEAGTVLNSGHNTKDSTSTVAAVVYDDSILENLEKYPTADCNRYEKGHKICQSCRMKKRKSISSIGSETSLDERSIVRNIEVEQLFTKTKHLPTSQPRISSKVILEANSNSVLKIKEKSRKMTPILESRSLSSKEIKVSLGMNRQSEKGTVTINSEIQIPSNFGETENNIPRFFLETGKERNDTVARNSEDSPEAPFADTNELNTGKNGPDGVVDGKDRYGTQITSVGGHGSKKRKVTKNKSSDICSSRNVIGECDESESNDNENMTRNLEGYRRHDMIIEKPPHENMMLPQSFSIPHDHSQLNRQLKQLSQYTSHASTSGGDNGDDDDESVLVDLDDLESIGMGYDMEDVDAEASTVGEGNVEYEEEKETMLRHVRAVQAGLLSSTAEPSDAEMAAAVEAVAVAAAVARSREEEK